MKSPPEIIRELADRIKMMESLRDQKKKNPYSLMNTIEIGELQTVINQYENLSAWIKSEA